jgi:hypothetical protein
MDSKNHLKKSSQKCIQKMHLKNAPKTLTPNISFKSTHQPTNPPLDTFYNSVRLSLSSGVISVQIRGTKLGTKFGEKLK